MALLDLPVVCWLIEMTLDWDGPALIPLSMFRLASANIIVVMIKMVTLAQMRRLVELTGPIPIQQPYKSEMNNDQSWELFSS